MTWEGIIPRKRRKSFERFLHHADPRIRDLAEEMQEEDRATRRLMRAGVELDETWAETSEQAWTEPNEAAEAEPNGESWLTEIPF
ncbi:MAG: hypothetical protein ACC628_24475 [Pirellulaceae bacterium]